MKHVLMLGPAIDSPGGMSSVVATYKLAGLFDRWPVRYVATYRLPNWPSKLANLIHALLKVIALLLMGRVALLHVHTASRGSFWRKSLFVLLARAARVPVLLHVHSGEFMHFYGVECGPLRRAYVRWILRLSQQVICLTPNWETNLKSIEPNARTVVIVNPVEHFDAVRECRDAGAVQPGQILFLGRLREKKGVFDLLRAMPEVLAHVPSASLVLAGDGDVDQVRALAAELGIAQSVHCPGWVEGPAKCEHLSRCEVFVLPSHAEGLPVCVLEAMACGVPLVSTSVGGIPEVTRDGDFAVLVAPHDINALAAALVVLLTEPGTRERLRTEALAHVLSEYDVDSVLRKLESCYRNALSSASQGV